MIQQNNILEFDHVVCGGGLVGAIWALYLRRRSTSVAIFQSYYDLRKQLIPGGRSINLVLSKKGLDSLQQLGIRQQVVKNTIPIRGQMIHLSTGEIFRLPYGIKQKQTSFCVARNKLSQCLLDIVQNNNIQIFFQHTLIEGNVENNTYTFRVQTQENPIEVKVKAKYMYGTDGAGSKVRDLILKQTQKQTHVEWYPADYKQLFLPSNSQTGNYPLDPNWVHIWPRGGHLIMGHANANRTFSMTLIAPSKGQNSFSEIESEQQTDKYFPTNYPDLNQKIPNMSLQLTQNPIGYLGTIRCPVWHYKDKVVLLGDAAHTICPFLWQAVNIGFDDCMYLDLMIDKYGFGEQAFAQYFKLQKPKADALAQITINNFDVLATLTNNKQFLQLKRIEKQLQHTCPQRFWSKYRMIFYGDRPYNQILGLIKKYESFLLEYKEKCKDPQKKRLFLIEQQFKKFNI